MALKIGFVIVIILMIYAVIKAYTWKVSAAAVLYYIESKGYMPPNNEEMKACIKEVNKHMVEDYLKGHVR